MNIFDFAIRMEQDGEKFYGELKDKTTDIGLKNILTLMENEEIQHGKMLEKMRDADSYDVYPTVLLKETNNLIEEMKKEGKYFDLTTDEINLWKQILEFEKNAVNFYKDKSKDSLSEVEREALLKIAAEEEKHVVMVENIIEHISKPMSWVEDAEFGVKSY